MHPNRTPATLDAATLNDLDRLNLALAAIVVQAGQLAKGSPARVALAQATKSILSTLGNLDGPA